MRIKHTRTMLATVAVAIAAIGALQAQDMGQMQHGVEHAGHEHGRAVAEHARLFEGVDRAVALLMPTQGHRARGVVYFEEDDGEVTVRYRIEGLEPGSEHGFHVHEFGDLTSADGTSLGGHYNPEGHPHELPGDQPRHAGDLGNIEANDDGIAEGEITVDNITIAGLKNPIIGRGLVVHAERDTGEGESGEAGARISVGVIGVAQRNSGD